MYLDSLVISIDPTSAADIPEDSSLTFEVLFVVKQGITTTVAPGGSAATPEIVPVTGTFTISEEFGNIIPVDESTSPVSWHLTGSWLQFYHQFIIV